MFSIRNLTKALPRNFIRSSTPLSRRTFTSLRTPSPFKQPWRLSSMPLRATFSTGVPRWQSQEGAISDQLSAKLEEELRIEHDEADSSEMPEHIKEFLDNSSFQIKDSPGEEEVVMTRSFGNENIRITFTIADIDTMGPDADYAEDPALYDEPSAAINQGGVGNPNFKQTPEDAVSPADRDALNEDGLGDETPSFPARVNITIEKKGVSGALQVEAEARDGEIIINNVHHFAKSELADAQTVEQDWARRIMYTGPPFGNLDEGLQGLLEEYLAERGIDSGLAQFIPDYIDYKEQREYVNWLGEMKDFIEA